MSIDDIGARNLIAGILKKACDDYTNNTGCPDWCTFGESCADNKIDFKHCDAKQFLRSAWCAALCDGLDIDHDEYVAACIKKRQLSKNMKFGASPNLQKTLAAKNRVDSKCG